LDVTRVLLTGARGRLGAALRRFLEDRGLSEDAVSRSELELSRSKAVVEFVKSRRPALVFHTAAMTDVDACERQPERARRDNLEATRNLARAAAEVGARFIHFSSDYVFDGAKPTPYVETDAPNPLSVYGRTKLAAEQAVSSALSDYVIIRVAWLFGAPGDFVSFVRRTLAEGRVLRLTTDHRGSPGYIPDLLEPIHAVALSDERGVFHLTNSGDCTRFEMGLEVVRLLGLDAEPVGVSGDEVGFIAPRPPRTVLSCTRYERRFARRMRSWQEALSDYLADPGQD